MTASTLTRSQKAMQIERRTWRQWSPSQGIGINLPSQTKPDVTYRTTRDGCTCPDHTYRLIVCKHMIATRIFMGRNS